MEKKHKEGRLSLHPLKFEDALRGLLATKPPKKTKKTKAKKTRKSKS